MKLHRLLFAALAVGIFALTASAQETKKEEPKARPGFDAELAKKVGADQYGMRTYVLVLLKTGPARVADKAESDKIFGGHFANMKRLVGEGKLALAGPFSKDPDFRGLFIMAVPTIEEAKALTETDPAIKAGVLAAEYHVWWGSAGLMEVNRIHDKVQKVDM
jgi:uncharacterized protein YciI